MEYRQLSCPFRLTHSRPHFIPLLGTLLERHHLPFRVLHLQVDEGLRRVGATVTVTSGYALLS